MPRLGLFGGYGLAQDGEQEGSQCKDDRREGYYVAGLPGCAGRAVSLNSLDFSHVCLKIATGVFQAINGFIMFTNSGGDHCDGGVCFAN